MAKVVDFYGISINPSKIDWVGKIVVNEDARYGKFNYSLAGKIFEVHGTEEVPAEQSRQRLHELIADA